MVDRVGKVVIPGEILTSLQKSDSTSKIVLGPGTRQETDLVVVSKPGVLRFKEPNIYWVDCFQKRVSIGPGTLEHTCIAAKP
jgi:exosome complex component RRP40